MSEIKYYKVNRGYKGYKDYCGLCVPHYKVITYPKQKPKAFFAFKRFTDSPVCWMETDYNFFKAAKHQLIEICKLEILVALGPKAAE